MMNQKNNYQLLSLDMDGTLLNSAKQIPCETTAAIQDLMERGVEVVVGTGRGLAELADYRNAFQGMHYGLLVSGGLIYDFQQEKPLTLHALSLEQCQRLLEAAADEDAMVHILTVHDSVAREQDIFHMDDFSMSVYQDMYERICDRQDDLVRYVQEHADEILKINLYHRSTASRERSRQRLAGLGMNLVLAEKTGLEASPAGITKASGLKELCKLLNIPLAATVAVGDAPNDLEILQIAGLSAAMGNATDSIKEICDVIVSDNDHNGVLEVIRRYFL
ncbi:HAD family hydrolase [Selenomonas sp. FC4001]|uniref:HAD family hydrolase n=1 Tax=Selenomonas sp. FC4001 TaxID=1408313 RepID=UPI000ACF7844|nr:HAD family hydrolase [Selenomonas sp. FC4001]